MKTLKNYIFILACSMFMGACSSSFLDSEPITELTDANFYKTTEDAEMAIVGCYDGLQLIYAEGVAFPVASEVLSDNTFGGTGNTDGLGYQQIDEFDLSRSPSDLNQFEPNWKNYYKALYRVNMLLLKLDQIDWKGDVAYRNSIEAQARFLRAYFYFDMVRLWERVPLIIVPTKDNVPQAEPDDIYAQITDDLLFAAENGDEEVSPGRVNKWAAKSLLARVYLFYTGYYNKTDLVGKVSKTQALQGLEDVISSQKYGLVGTSNDGKEFKDLWPAASSKANSAGDGLETTYVGKDNKETIFAIKYNITSDYNGNTDGNHWLVMLGLREQSFCPYGKGWGACTVNPKLYNAFENGDKRKTASIIAIQEEGLNFKNSGQREYTGYSIKKYTPLSLPDGRDVAEANNAVNFMIGQFQDYVVIRYADVLLMAAELGSANAQTYFDLVRQRAGLTSKTVNQDNIMAERRFEFAFEGIRYWDLLRQGLTVAASTIAESTTVLNGGVQATKTITQQNITKTRGFQMIPYNQITLSAGVLTQNEGWK
ncbi:RagB/SusD family nutrient uptake outer membrane protein [Porphyromonadaceae sp. NP-X]|jgi:hypothetical protein|nr:RagB/SusD family nutrient uptake outer membrane protein [Porphyromonadaceae sp. NP-X]NLJ20181.1 RagB/SusD family nutrient uptake outer membrane protein [Bacteroidales bacterium]